MSRNFSALHFLLPLLVLFTFPNVTQAESTTISAVIPWQGQGEIFPTGTDQFQFLGAIEGIMYLERANGDMNEAFVKCPIIQDIDAAEKTTSASGKCTIVVSTNNAVFAELACEGRAGLCRGEFRLTGGTGRFAGISGSGEMVIRSPVHALAADLSDGTVLHIAAGILQLPKLSITLP